VKILDWIAASQEERLAALARPVGRAAPELQARVREIVASVRNGGWEALASISQEIDGAEPVMVEVAPFAANARRSLSADEVAAIELAARNIAAFHRASMPADITVETASGLTVRKVWRAIDRVGLYVPGGATPLFSTLLMLALPARAAGVREMVVVTPPQRQGSIAPALALAAELCGIEQVWTVGGAQAIAALAFGAGDITPVAKICGPGNAWVAEAKTQVAAAPGGPAIDLPAGPSELMVIADGSADPDTVAADLLSQAEHDASAQVLLVATDCALAGAIAASVDRQVQTLPRQVFAEKALSNGRSIVVGDLTQAVAIANAYAPEHLSLAVAVPDSLVPLIRNAGAVFAGHGAAETFGDYLAGSSHVLPTDGAARAFGGVSVHTFLKAMSVQSITPEAARALAGPAAVLARLEGLEAHARAADARAYVPVTA
jgi:histidinol dehydrogenase